MLNGGQLAWNPLSSTLVCGERDALLIDPPFTYLQVPRVGDWIERSGKRLTSIYISDRVPVAAGTITDLATTPLPARPR